MPSCSHFHHSMVKVNRRSRHAQGVEAICKPAMINEYNKYMVGGGGGGGVDIAYRRSASNILRFPPLLKKMVEESIFPFTRRYHGECIRYLQIIKAPQSYTPGFYG